MEKNSLIALAIVIGAAVFAAIIAVPPYNKFVRHENDIEAVDKDMQNVHATMMKSMKGQGLAVDKYGDLLLESIEKATEGRYGDDGAKATFLWMQENHPEIDSSVIRKLQQVIEASYNKFAATQRKKIDMVRTYKNSVQTFPGNQIAYLFGFPRTSFDEMGSIVTSAETKRDFEMGELSDPPTGGGD